MATDNVVRVLFECYTDSLRRSVEQVTDSLRGLGNQGRDTSRKLELRNAQRETRNFSGEVRTATDNTRRMGREGEQAGDQIRKGMKRAESGVDRFRKSLNKVMKVLAVSYIASKVKSFFGSFVDYVQEGSEMATSFALNQQKLTQVMRNTMDATDAEIQSIVKLTEAQENLGVVSKTAQIAGAQELGTYLEKSESLKRLIPIMNDMVAQQYGANASQESAVGIATMLGKVMEGQVGALLRYGYSFDELQEGVLKYGTEAERVAVLFEVIGGSVGGMNEALAETDAGKIGALATALDNTKIKVGEMTNAFKAQIAGQILPHMGSLSDTVIRVFDNIFTSLSSAFEGADVESIIRNIEMAMASLGQMFVQTLQNLPSIIETVASNISWLSENLRSLIEIVKIGIGVWLGFQTAMMVVSIAANPVLFIIGLITAAIVKLYTEFEWFRRIVTIAIETVKLAVLGLARLWLTQFRLMANAVAFLTSLIPGIGDAMQDVANRINGLMDGIDNKIVNTGKNIAKLLAGVNEASGAVSSLKDDTGGVENWNNDYSFEMPTISQATLDAINNAGKGSSSKASSGSATAKDNRTAFEKAKEKVEDEYRTREDLINSQITLAETTGNERAKKSFQQTLTEMYNEKLGSLIGLDKLTASTDERNILETAKNRILTEIAKVTNDIKEGVNELLGSFNAPSEITALTEYAYNTNNSTNNNSILSRVISTPTMNMYLTVKDLGNNSAADARSKLGSFANAMLGKDDIVFNGMRDVVRN